MSLKRPLSENDVRYKGWPLACNNCGNKPLPAAVAQYGGTCELCGDEVLAYTVESAELFVKMAALRESILALRTEVNCRIEHGAESGGHLDYVQAQLDNILKQVPQ